ncbi:oleandomycin glycosyltransferase [Streptomyces ruber]|uniref:Oleandomycin glycosyltransferase n=2 Tax=Streptomyces TaxID=1883 RepID=A0A918BBC2_9ACTN|nr:glycosyltransferase [Streptomyces ruber]GGQ52662.1 oleandomycin glycosyltransferase [Streptomyces ruber]
MRVLCTTIGSPSHGRAQLPLLRALAAAGHDIQVATTPQLVDVFRHDDVRVTSCIPHFSPGDFASSVDLPSGDQRDMTSQEQQAALTEMMARIVSGPMARLLRDAVTPLAREFRPDLILRDGMDLNAVLLAEELGVPQLPTPSGASNMLDPADSLPHLNALRQEYGLPAQEDPLSVVAHGRVDYVPSGFSFARHLPDSLAYRQTVEVDRSSILPRWVAELPTDRPLVFAALGTALPMLHQREDDGQQPAIPIPFPDPVEALRTLVEAAGLLEDCTVIVATAGMPVDGTGAAPHVHLTDRLPQPLLLENVDLFLTHGGFNSVRESLRTATPMAVLPQFGDQYPNARRVEELGLGREITDRTPEGIAAVCRQILGDPGIAATTRRARLAMLALPEVATAVDDLQKLAS